MEYAFHNGKFIRARNAKMRITNIEFNYGFGVYENLRVRRGRAFFADEHVDRLFSSAKLIDLKHGFLKDDIKRAIGGLINKNRVRDCNIKIFLIGGANPQLYIFCLAPKFLDKKYYKQGVRVVTEQYQRYLPRAKTLNMLPSYLIFRAGEKRNAYDVLLLDENENIMEGTRSNFFAVKGDMLYTPESKLILNGVTRQTVIQCARRNKYRIKEKLIKLNRVLSYDGAFLTNTSGKIIPIKFINDSRFERIPQSILNLIKLYNIWLKSVQ